MSSRASRPVRLALTAGDPRGIGPEIVRAAATQFTAGDDVSCTVIGPTMADLHPDLSVGIADPGVAAAEAGRLAGLAIERAVELALHGHVDGIVTAPLDKGALHAGGYDYPGHTEMLAELAGVRTVMMMAGTPPGGAHPLRVILATTHIPLRTVPDALTAASIEETAAIVREGLRRWFGMERPRLALCALNPHGGEGGRFGDEELRVLTPAARSAGLAGPFPADTVFVRALKGEFDAVIAPYHDVGMTAIKVAAFGRAVNVTLGLPFPRTSPDHGTALDIAGRGVADPGSMIEAVRVCAAMVRSRRADA